MIFLFQKCMVERYFPKNNRTECFWGYLLKLEWEYFEIQMFHVIAIICLVVEMYCNNRYESLPGYLPKFNFKHLEIKLCPNFYWSKKYSYSNFSSFCGQCTFIYPVCAVYVYLYITVASWRGHQAQFEKRLF